VDFGRGARRGRSFELPEGKLGALDAVTGEAIYKRSNNIYGTLLAFSQDHDVLIMKYYEAHAFLSLGVPPDVAGRMTAFRGSTGDVLWEIESGIDSSGRSRPVINGGTVFVEPSAYDVRTGAKLDFNLRRSHGCGILACSERMMLFRSATLAYIDLGESGREMVNYGGIRPGCWVNAIPAGGLVFMPDATDRCTCSYLNKATIALMPMR